MRRYELMLLLRPDLEDDKLQSAVEKVTRAIVNAGGSLSKVSPWGKRRLAYDIGQFREASYFLIHFDIEPVQVRGIERGLLISEEILRHLVTVLEEREAASREEEVPAARPLVEAEPVEGRAVGAREVGEEAAELGEDEEEEEEEEEIVAGLEPDADLDEEEDEEEDEDEDEDEDEESRLEERAGV
jgi:small subunit ribosomal protein S6